MKDEYNTLYYIPVSLLYNYYTFFIFRFTIIEENQMIKEIINKVINYQESKETTEVKINKILTEDLGRIVEENVGTKGKNSRIDINESTTAAKEKP